MLVFASEILSGQAPDSCTVELYCDEYDYYATAVVERDGLIADTTIQAVVIRKTEKIVDQQAKQLVLAEDKNFQQVLVTEKWKKGFHDVNQLYEKAGKKITFFKTTTFIFGTTTTLLVAGLLLFR